MFYARGGSARTADIGENVIRRRYFGDTQMIRRIRAWHSCGIQAVHAWHADDAPPPENAYGLSLRACRWVCGGDRG